MKIVLGIVVSILTTIILFMSAMKQEHSTTLYIILYWVAIIGYLASYWMIKSYIDNKLAEAFMDGHAFAKRNLE
jgi:hypothetical protein